MVALLGFEESVLAHSGAVEFDASTLGDLNMKKIAIALTAVAAFTGSAVAADMAPRAYTKAPAPVVAVANWTGCYVGGGGGYGLWNQDNTGYLDTGTLPGTGARIQTTERATAG